MSGIINMLRVQKESVLGEPEESRRTLGRRHDLGVKQ